MHTSLPVALPRWVAAAVMTPATHRRHHTLDGGATNLGPVLTIWDRLAGTWDPTPVATGAPIGLRGAGADPGRSAWRIETEGWIDVAHRSLRNRRASTDAAGYG